MNLELSFFPKLFDTLPEAVFFLEGTSLLYANPAGQALLSHYDGEDFLARLPLEDGELLCAHEQALFHVTVSPMEGRRLVILRPIQEPPELCASTIPAQLRSHLATLSFSLEHLAQQLSQTGALDAYRTLLQVQNQSCCRILRLTQQMELAAEGWELDFPRSVLDLLGICRRRAFELESRLDGKGPQFTFAGDAPMLLLSGNQTLLEQMLFALLSNAIKAAGPQGQVSLTASQVGKQAIVTVWDSGEDIPEDRLRNLFSPPVDTGLPRPNEGAGLDLFLAHRIALYHGGVLMAANHPRGGSEFTLSLPLADAPDLLLQSPDFLPDDSGFSALLVGLADALPLHTFDPVEL